MMKLVRERVLELLATDCRVEIEKDRRVVIDVEHETVSAGLDDRIDLRADVCVSWQVSQGEVCRTRGVRLFPARERLFESGSSCEQLIRQHERLEVRVFK